jgi:2-hydroxymuconate-semialdehyde hydrolase
MSENPEIGKRVRTGVFESNVHDEGKGAPVLLIHGSGPGVSAWANWRLVLPALAEQRRVIAPDMVGFGYTDRPQGIEYGMPVWVQQALDLMDALGVERADVVGNSFGGGLALALAIRAPQRVRRMVLMGAMGVSFPITPGLEAVWGYEPSFENMKKLLDVFAYSRELVNDELARMRYEASIRPGFHESFSAMFPAPRQRSVEGMTSPEDKIRALPHETLIVHGREDKVIPQSNAIKLLDLMQNAQLHIYGNCGHWTQIEHTARFNRLVGDFLAEADANP